MSRQWMRRPATLFAAAAGALFLCAGLTAAQAATITTTTTATAGHDAQPDYTCPAKNVCFYSGNDWNGTHWALPTDQYNGKWHSFGSVGITPDPGSVTDNSGSTVWVYDKEAGAPKCMSEGTDDPKEVLGGSYGYFYIIYGVNTCGPKPPTPLP